MDFLGLCREFISHDTTPSSGNSLLAQRAASLCAEVGLEVEVFEESVHGLEQVNLVARAGPGDRDELVLQAHLDTPDPGPHGAWTKTGANPFQATIYEDRLFGLGASCAKLDFLCKWQALKELQSHNFKRRIALVGTYGEESGISGVSRLMRRRDLSAKYALVGAPTDLHLVEAGKGLVIVEITVPFSNREVKYREDHDQLESTSTQSKMFRGVAAHSSAPEHGDNAILKMLNYVSLLPEGVVIMDLDGGVGANSVPSYAFLEIDVVGHVQSSMKEKLRAILVAIGRIESEFPNYQDREFSPSLPTLNVGQIRTYSDHVALSGCFRMPPSVSDSVYKAWMRQLKADCEKVQSTLRIVDYKPPFRALRQNSFVELCREGAQVVCGRSDSATLSVATEASVLAGYGVDALIFGPGVAQGNAHSPDESVRVQDLFVAKDYYRYILERFCL